MTTITKEKAGITIQTYLPKEALTNEKAASWGIESKGKVLTEEGLYEKLGIRTRSIAGDSETVLSMARRVMVDLPSLQQPRKLFLSTTYPDGVNNAEELAKEAPFLVDDFMNTHAACSGTALNFAYIFEHSDKYRGKPITMVASEIYSRTLVNLENPEERAKDPSLALLIFADGSASMDFTEGEDLEILNTTTYTFPENKSSCLKMPIQNRLVRNPALTVDVPNDTKYFWMDGGAVLKAILTTLPDMVEQTIKEARLNPKQVRLVVPHQASKPMLDGLESKLPSLEVYRDLEEGNLSSVSILKALGKAQSEDAFTRGDRLVLAGFGAGLFASVAVVQIN